MIVSGVEHDQLAAVHFGERLVLRLLRAEEDALDRPEHVAGGQDHAEAGDDRERDRSASRRRIAAAASGSNRGLRRLERAEQHHHFADEPAQARQAEVGEERRRCEKPV